MKSPAAPFLFLFSFLFLSPGPAAVQQHHPSPTTALPSDPYDFVSRGTATVVPGARYAAGSFKRWLLGNHYRDLWTMPLDVPVIDLDWTAGGLTVLDRGGGNQTATLHLMGADGRLYDLRSVDKSVRLALPEKYHGTFIERLVQDQIASLNPFGALIVPPLAHAAGILHPHPTLVVVPHTPRLGPHRDEFAGMLAIFERDADEDHSDAAQFGFAENLIGTRKLFEKLSADSNAHVDVRAYARARLFDMLIGDWDRHEGQWRWAKFETEHGTRFAPVPTDRDGAFAKFDGLINRIGRLTSKKIFRRVTDFRADIPDIRGLNWQAFDLDRRLTADLTQADWLSIADSLTTALTDSVIEFAVRTWPAPVYDLIGPMTAHNLMSRRDHLPSIASRYYEMLAEAAEKEGHRISGNVEPPDHELSERDETATRPDQQASRSSFE